MRAVVAHRDPTLISAARGALEGAGWHVVGTPVPAEIARACRTGGIDVAFVESGIVEDDPGLLQDLKRRPESFATTVVVIADREQTVAEALDALGGGAHDVILAPFTDAELVARASAAARTRALVEELLERDERIERLVFVDELTGLYNRRYILHHMGMLVAGARRHDRPLSVVMLDVDRFKPINDTYGHPTGDAVLRSVADAVASRLRREDVAGRIGGDEFVVLLPETRADGAATVAEQIRRQVAGAGPLGEARDIRVTVSVGWVTWAGEDLDELLKRVDDALYAAKAAGRDRVAAAAS